MKTLSGIMSHQSKEEYLENCRARYPSRNRTGKSTMIDEVSDAFGWERKHTIKALNGKVSLGAKAKKRGSKRNTEQPKLRSSWPSGSSVNSPAASDLKRPCRTGYQRLHVLRTDKRSSKNLDGYYILFSLVESLIDFYISRRQFDFHL